MQRLALLCLLCSLFTPVIAQSIQIDGTVVDAENGAGIPFANLQLLDANRGTSTDQSGVFSLRVAELPATVVFSSIGYQTDTFTIRQPTGIQVLLRPLSTELPTVEITANTRLEAINDPDFRPISFAVWNNHIALLGKRGLTKKYQLEVFDHRGKLVKSHQLDIGRVVDVRTNCLGQFYLNCKDYLVEFTGLTTVLEAKEKISIPDYETLFANCLGITDSLLLFEVVSYNGLLKRYVAASRVTKKDFLFKQVAFGDQIRRYRGDFGYITYGYNISNMGEVWIKENEYLRNQQETTEFLERFMYHNPTKNQLFVENNAFTLFNFDEDHIQFFNPAGKLLGANQIHFNSEKSDKDIDVRHDPITGNYFALRPTGQGLSIERIDAGTGRATTALVLPITEYLYLSILDDTVFVLGDQPLDALRESRGLYQERIPKTGKVFH